MTRRTTTGLVVAAGLLCGTAGAFPTMGQFSITPGIGAALVSNQDIKDLYGPGLSITSSPVALALGGGLDYNVSDMVQLGARYDRVLKKYEVSLSSGGAIVGTDTWNVNANALLGHARFLIKGRSPDRWYAISLLLGQYALSGASLETTISGGGSATLDLTGSTFGGEAALEMEKSFGGQVAGALRLGWRFAKITNVTGSVAGATGRLTNADGSAAALDLGGLNAGVTLRVYFGGSGSSVSSY